MAQKITLTFTRWATRGDGQQAMFYLEDIEGGRHRAPGGGPPEVNEVTTPERIEEELRTGGDSLSAERQALYRAALAARPK